MSGGGGGWGRGYNRDVGFLWGVVFEGAGKRRNMRANGDCDCEFGEGGMMNRANKYNYWF